MNLLLIGTGRMARAYAPVLAAHTVGIIAVGRSKEGSAQFQKDTGIDTTSGGITRWRKTASSIPTHAIVAVDDAASPHVAQELIDIGVTHILLEKPGALSRKELLDLQKKAQKSGAAVHIGYNRRFLASVQKAQEIIKADGGVISFHFEFNERTTQPERIAAMNIPEKTVEHWFVANSTHVVDLALFLAGNPLALSGFTAKGPLWATQDHATLFTGAGITDRDVPFSYYANWEIDGPWLVEIQTSKRKLILNPLEKLTAEKDGTIDEVAYDNSLDTKFRPGLYREVESFFNDLRDLKTLDEQIQHFDWYEKICPHEPQ